MAFDHLVELLKEIRLADVVDIAVVTTLLYTAIALIRRTQAGFVAIGILMIGAVYVAARALDLRLTAWIFQGFFAVFLIILVVIFQEELRQLFERIAVWSFRRRRERPAPFEAADIVVKCVADFASSRIGALIVIPGKQPIQRHTRRGIELNGKLSEPLLKSIFDSHSPGHDGAIIVEDDRLSRFAVRLPLSNDFEQLRLVGTRHAAALGLAELSDALCVVVSEERGQVSVAHARRLRRLDSPQQLGVVMHDFLGDLYPARRERRMWLDLARENWVEKLASLVLVIGLWYLFIPGARPAAFTYQVPVNVANVPVGSVLDHVDPPEVTAVFTGLRRMFYLFDPKSLELTIDASLAKFGRRTFKVTPADIRYPNDLTLENIRPDQVKISLAPAPSAARADAGAEESSAERAVQ